MDTRQPTAIGTVVASPLYRGATIALFLSGLGTSAATPLIATYLTHTLGASFGTAGLYYLTGLTSPIAGYLIGARSDRTGRRMGLFWGCTIMGAIGWLIFALANQLWIPFATNALILAFAGASGSQMFAAIHDELEAHPSPHGDAVISIVRMALTAGWIVGPVIGTVLSDRASLRWMFAYCSACYVGQLLPMVGVHVAPAHLGTVDEPRPSGRPTLHAMTPLLFFTAMFLCVYAGESIRYAYLPIYMRDHLDLSAAARGSALGLQPLVELAIMPLSVVVGRRIGYFRTLAIGAGFAMLAYLCFALAGSVTGVFVGQAMMGIVWGVFFGLGIMVAQRLLPEAVATATSIFMNCTAIAMAFGGLVGGVGAEQFGLPHVFLLPAVMGAIACAGLLVAPRLSDRTI